MKILFICSSNVCRSPFAQLVFERMVESDETLAAKVDSVRSAAVLNKSRRLHPMAMVSLLVRGFERETLESFRPSYVLCDRRLFDEADMIVGMAAAHKTLLPIRYKKKFRLLSSVAGVGEISIPDPFLKKTQEGYEAVMDVIVDYLQAFAEEIKKGTFDHIRA